MSSIGKRLVVAAALAAALLLNPSMQVMHGQTASKPNIVVIMIDDFDLTSLWTLVANGKMPNLMKYFVTGGAIFSEAFSVNGLGGPSRATLLTGQYAHNHGVTWGFPPRDLQVATGPVGISPADQLVRQLAQLPR